MPQNSGHFFEHGCYFFSRANPRCWHRGFTSSSFTNLVKGSDQKVLKGQACPSYGLKPCSVPTLQDLWLTAKAEKTPRELEGANTRKTAPSEKGNVSSQQRLPFNKKRKPPKFWAKMQVNLPHPLWISVSRQEQGRQKPQLLNGY